MAIERRFARLVGLPLARLRRYPGSAATWQNHRFPGTTAFVVELPSGALSMTAADRYADAVVTVVDSSARLATMRRGGFGGGPRGSVTSP